LHSSNLLHITNLLVGEALTIKALLRSKKNPRKTESRQERHTDTYFQNAPILTMDGWAVPSIGVVFAYLGLFLRK
jgi:hypothetical protein